MEMNPSPLFVEESVKDNLSYRSIVVWRGGKLQLLDKNLVKKFWHGFVGHDSVQGDGQKGVEAQIAEKNKDIRSKDQIIRMKDNLLEARDRLMEEGERKRRADKKEQSWHLLRESVAYLEKNSDKWKQRKLKEVERVKQEDKADRLAIVAIKKKAGQR